MKYERIAQLIDWWKTHVLLIENNKEVYFKEGEVWWCSIGMNVGDEEFGKGTTFRRPVLIFKKFSNNSFLGLPLAGKEKEGSWYVPTLVIGKKGSVMLNQARVFDRKRLQRRIMVMTKEDRESITIKFRELYCPINFITPPLDGEAGIGGKSQIVP